jgi:putative nucleotidyltransferase with HDIG domain
VGQQPTLPSDAGWRARPAAALGLRALVVLVPLVAAVGVAVVVTRAMPRPTGPGDLAVVWGTGFVISTIVLFGTTRLLRRLLPLAALLELSLTFPDHTPSRLGVALRAGNLRSPGTRRAAMHSAAHGSPAEGAEAVLALAAALSSHDRATRGHSERVRAYTEVLCDELHLPAADRARLRWASLLHDVGKMAVPAALLNKEGALDDDEWATLRSHPTEGAKLTNSLAPWLGPWAAVIAQHHERWDGKGYPLGLAGTDIQQGARIVAVADAYEVMTAARAYKKPISASEARSRLAADAGRQFDPNVVRAFLNVSLGRMRVAAGPLAWLAQVPFLRPAAAVTRGPASIALGGALAAAVVTLAVPPVESPTRAPVAIERPRSLGLPVEQQTVELTVTTPDAPVTAPPTEVLAATATRPTDAAVPAAPVPQPPAPAAGPELAPGQPQPPAPSPTPPPDPSAPGPALPPPPVDQTPTPLVHVSVELQGPVDAGMAVGVGDASTAPVAPVTADVQVTL